MKQLYEKADAEVVLFDNSDIITTSGGDDINSGGGNVSTVTCYTNVFGVGGGITPGWN